MKALAHKHWRVLPTYYMVRDVKPFEVERCFG
jgi:hypothetical protein